MKKINWPVEVDNFLLLNFKKLSNPALSKAILSELNFSVGKVAIAKRLKALSLCRPKFSNRFKPGRKAWNTGRVTVKRLDSPKTEPWTAEEFQFLEDNYISMGNRALSEALNRTKAAVKRRLRERGLMRSCALPLTKFPVKPKVVAKPAIKQSIKPVHSQHISKQISKSVPSPTIISKIVYVSSPATTDMSRPRQKHKQKSPDLSKKVAYKLNARTTIYAAPGQDISALRKKFGIACT